MIAASEFKKAIEDFAETISQGPLGLVKHDAADFAVVGQCVENTLQMMTRDHPGQPLTGWYFLLRRWAKFPEFHYLIATHHVVWRRPRGELVDITPFHQDELHHPHTENGSLNSLPR